MNKYSLLAVKPKIPNQPPDAWVEHRCIRTSLEFQILDGIRRKLNIGEAALEAPAFETDANSGDYIRHCRLIVRRRSLDGYEMPRPLYLGLDMKQQIIEVYFTNCLRETRSGNIKRDADHNWVYGRASLLDQKQLTGPALKSMIRNAVAQAGAKYRSGGPFEKPLLKRAVEHPTVGPYILGETDDADSVG